MEYKKRTAQGNAARNKTQTKTLGRYKRRKSQNLADERRTTGRFAKRFSGERPVSLGFELTFLSEFREFVWRVLDRAAKRRACISQAPAKVPFLIFLKNSTSVNPIAVEKFRDLCYNINMMQTEHKMMVIDWNISYAGDAQIKIDFLKSLVSDTYCIILQEVTENSYEYLKKIFCQCTILYSLNYRKPSKFDSKARKLGVTIILSNDITVLKCGIVERNILPERTLFATVKTASKQEIRILGIHSITGCDYKKAKSLQYDCLAEFVSEYKPDIIGIDANEPQVDSYDISQMKFFNNGKGAETFFNEVKDIGLSDAFVLFHDIATKSDIVPLAVSHRINNKIPVRYDFIFVNNSFNVKSFSYDYKNAVNAGSDHAILICNI